MNFSTALEEIKKGSKLTRKSWNGPNQYVFLIPGSMFKVDPDRPLAQYIKPGTVVMYKPHIDIKLVDGSICPWFASMIDLFADDWEFA